MIRVTSRPVRYLLQVFNYTLFMGLIWYFASAPSFRVLDENQSVITVAFSHAGKLREACRKLSAEELAELPPNMRKPEDCPRERSPVAIEMKLDGKLLYKEKLEPPGLFGDGGVDVYFSQKITAGEHLFEIKMDDSIREKGTNHQFEGTVRISPSRILLVEFDSNDGFLVR